MFTKFEFNPAHKKSVLYLEKQERWKNSAKCALCSAKCALCGSVRSIFDCAVQTASKKDAYAENFRKISPKIKKMWAEKKYVKWLHVNQYMERKMMQRLRKTWICTQVCSSYFLGTSLFVEKWKPLLYFHGNVKVPKILQR